MCVTGKVFLFILLQFLDGKLKKEEYFCLLGQAIAMQCMLPVPVSLQNC